jgi:hypothetical protein
MIRAFFALATFAALAYSSTANAQGDFKQIKLTEAQIEKFIAAQKDMAALNEKAEGSSSNSPDAKLEAEFDGVAKKHGFKDFAEYDAIATNVSMIMTGLDPQTKAFTEPPAAIKKQIEEVQADKSIDPKEKKEMLDELRETLKYAQPIQYRENIDLVKKNFDRIEAALQ